METARAWAEAAPHSVVENLYGPTELTIACTLYRGTRSVRPRSPSSASSRSAEPYPGMSAIVVDDELREVAPGEEGELLLAGPQVTLGYWRDPERTAAAFVVPPGVTRSHYRTGDRVRRPLGTAR